jgi:hypothetical protein
VTLLAAPAPGQVTGGSFGTSNWGGAAGSSSGPLSGSTSSYGSSGSTSSYGSSTSSSGSSSSHGDADGRFERAGVDTNEEHSSTQGTLMLLWCLTVAVFVGCFHRKWTMLGVTLLAMAVMATLIGNVTTARDLARAPPGTRLEFDRDDGDWVDGTLVRARPGGLYEVSGVRDRRIVLLRSRRVRGRYGLFPGGAAPWQPGHLLLVFDGLVLLGLVVSRMELFEGGWGARRRREPWEDDATPDPPRPARGVRVGVLQLAFDHRQRAEIQAGFAALARRAGTEGTGVLLVEAARFLAARASALRGAHAEATALDGASFEAIREEARRVFGERVTAERGRYVVETIRGDEGGVREASVAVTARAEEGAGFVVVTLVLAWRGRVDLLDRAIAAGGLDVLAASALDPSEVEPYALEAVWVPAVETDRMSSAELATVFPKIRWLDTDAEGSLGRVTCDACRSVYAGELSECPTCGAPRVSS